MKLNSFAGEMALHQECVCEMSPLIRDLMARFTDFDAKNECHNNREEDSDDSRFVARGQRRH